MKCKVKNADFSRELRLLEKVVGKKPTIEVLSNVLIQVHESALVMSATDLEVGLIGACVAEVEEPGSLTLPVKRLTSIVKAQSGDEITLSTDSRGGVTFKSGKFRSTLQTLPPTDFPTMPNMEGEVLELSRDDLKRMIPQVRYAISDQDSRYLLHCAYMGLDPERLLLAAIDGPRLSVVESKRSGEEGYDPVLVPAKAMDELSALLGEQQEKEVVQFSRSERHLFFDVDGRLMISRQIDGNFPQFDRFLPKDPGHKAVIDRDMVSSVLNRLVLIDDVVKLHFQSGVLGLSSIGSGVGNGEEDLFMEYDGPEMTVHYDGTLLLNFTSQAPSQNITLALKDEKSPLLLQDGDFQNVVMGVKKDA